MPSFYHGSVRQYLFDIARRVPKEIRRAALLVTGRRPKRSNKLNFENTLGMLVRSGQRQEALEAIGQSIELAKTSKDHKGLHHMAAALERLEIYDQAYKIRAEANALLDKSTGQKWDGRRDNSVHLTIEPIIIDRNSISYAIQYAPLIATAAERVASCRVKLDPRLIPLFSRTFEDVDFVSFDGDATDASVAKKKPGQKHMHCGLENLPEYFGNSHKKIRNAHQPLLPDTKKASALRRKYRVEPLPVIGVAWGSTNSRKDVPGFKDWGRLLKELPANIVSLQYGPVESAVKAIARASGKNIIHDADIDQMSDIDGFAAQLASLDMIVTISNTGAHLAGAMGIPMIVLLDDRFHLTWPSTNKSTPWYPEARLVRKDNRAWSLVMQEVRGLLEEILAARKISQDK